MAVHAFPPVLRIAQDRFRIRGLIPQSIATRRLMNWLHTQVEVREVKSKQDGTVEVQWSDPARLAEWQRSLADHLYTTLRPPPRPLDVRVVHHLPGRVRLRVSGASDDDILCLTAWIESRPGVLRVSGSPASHTILAVYDRALTTGDQIAVDARTSDPETWPPAPPPPPPAPWGNVALSSLALAGSLGGAPASAVSTLVAVAALPALRRSLEALQERRVSVDLLDVAAISLSIGTQQLTTGAFITWLLSIGDVLLEKAADRARAELTRLVSFDVPEAWLLDSSKGDGRAIRVPASRLKPGDRIVVSTGQRVAADGIVLSGIASIDEKALTGESELRECVVGNRVLAATVVVDGEIVVQVHRVGSNTTAARIVQLLGTAGAKPMTLQKNAERAADRLVLPTFGLAGALGLASQIERAMGVLITDFGTGLRISIPTAALAAVASAARSGVLVKGAQYLERLARADVVIFDKTGTLTEGQPEIEEIASLGKFSASEVLSFAASAEAHASHPVAHALRRRAEHEGIPVAPAERGSVSSMVGRGISAAVDGHTVSVGSVRWMRERKVALSSAEALLARHKEQHRSSLLIAVDGRLAGVLSYADRTRDESADVVRRLRAGGRRRVLLFSGDSRVTARSVGRALGVDEAIGEMLPEDKAAAVKQLQREGRVVAMIGDGINDAPALAYADVGISLHGGADVALETADVVLLKGGLATLPLAFEQSDSAMRHVRRGLWIVIVPNAAAIVLAAAGLLLPTAAALINNGTTIIAALSGLPPLLSRTRTHLGTPPVNKGVGTARGHPQG
jgi:Cu2+-exporting ATPase